LRLGIFGGTFDPVHLGHLILADEAQSQLNLDRVLWVLTPNSPHKGGKYFAPTEQRKILLEIALADNPAWELSLVEVNRQPPYYSLMTLRILKSQFTSDQLFFLMGGDSLRELPSWYHPKELLDTCDGLGVMHRYGENLDLRWLNRVLPGVLKKVQFFDSPVSEISSSDIRERISTGKPYRYYLHPEEYKYIHQNKLYHL